MAMLLTRTGSLPRRATVAGSCTTSFNITSIEREHNRNITGKTKKKKLQITTIVNIIVAMSVYTQTFRIIVAK